MFKRPFSFEGRIRRLEFGLSFIIFYAAIFVVAFTAGAFSDEYSDSDSSFLSLGAFVFIIPAYWFFFAQACKRCHDRGNSGWWQLIPFYGFMLLFLEGEHGVNEYGPNPKGIGNVDEIDEIGNYLSQDNVSRV